MFAVHTLKSVENTCIQILHIKKSLTFSEPNQVVFLPKHNQKIKKFKNH